MEKTKLNVLLAKTDHMGSVYKKGLAEYAKFFNSKQGAFKGERKTYVPREGTIDLPNLRSNKLVVTTVVEKLEYLERNAEGYIDALFSLEKTNSTGKAKAELKVDGNLFGEFSSLELLRLKTLLESDQLKNVYENIPVRSDDEIWEPTGAEMYTDREIFESTLMQGVNKSTIKEPFILQDPNVGKTPGAQYTPQVVSRDIVLELGDYTHQRFSGEMSHRDRAGILDRRSKLLTAVIVALKTANDTEAEKSGMTAKKLFDYLHGN